MAQLKSTIVQGALTVTSNVVANKLIKLGGTASQILMADGSVKGIGDLITIPNISITDTGTKPIVGDITSSGHTITVTRIGLDDLGLASAYKYKGSVATYANLPTSGNTAGDVWNVQSDGMNYAWTGSAWDALGATIDTSNFVTATKNASVSVAGTTKDTYTYNKTTIFAPNGLIMGGTAAAAGLVTRGICGVSTPDATTGACTKDNLYLNFDGGSTTTWNPTTRGVIINAGTPGTDLGSGMYQYCAVRGDIVKAWVEAKGYLTSHQSIKTLKTDNTTAQTVSASEAITGSGTINLHKISKTGSYNDLLDKPSIPNPSDYYWANVKVSTSSSTSTKPTFANNFLVNIATNNVLTPGADWAIASAIPKYLWHDLLPFRAAKAEYSTDGATWTEDTTDTYRRTLTNQKENQTITVLSDSRPYARFTWDGGSAIWHACQADWLVIGFAYAASAAKCSIKFQYSTDGTTWIDSLTVGSSSYGSAPSWFKINSSFSQCRAVRLVLTRTNDSGSLNLSSVKWLTKRWGNQGMGSELEKPYSWDNNANLYYRNASSTLGLSSAPWSAIYGTTIYEGGTSLTNKYLGKTAKAADSDKLDGQEGSYYLDYNNFTNTPAIPDVSDFVTKSTNQTITGIKTFSHSTFGAIVLKRNGSTNASSIIFQNSNGTLGSIGMTSTANGGLKRWSADTASAYTIWDSGNDGSGSGLDADLLDGKHASAFALAGDIPNDYLPKTTYEWNKEYAAGSNGAVSLGRYNLYDTQLTFDITTTTSITISGKLVIASQNGSIKKVTVYGDASNTLAGYLTIYQSAISSNNRSWVEVFCNFPGWSKNKVHIYAVALNSATVTRQMDSVTFTGGVPSGVTSGDTKWTGTIVNDITAHDAGYSGIGTCTTAAATAAKVVTLPRFALVENATILVRVSTTNSATSGVTLNVNSTGAKSIYIGGSAWSTSNQLNAGDYLATYDGTYWKLTRIYLTDNNTTYDADRGISLVSGKFGHSNTAIDAQSTKGLYKISYDAYGHITGTESFSLPTKDSWNYDDRYVKYSAAQSLTAAQKTQARTNIGAGTSNFSGSYNDLTDKPTIPTVNNATLTIQKNGTTVKTFTANASTDVTANITVPTKTSELTNDSGFWTGTKYWANVAVSGSSSTATTPSVQKIGITGSTTATASAAVTMEYDSSYKALKFVFA